MAMNTERGFTILSVMIAIILLTIGVMALSRSGFQVQAAETATATRTTALDLARAYMEDLRSRDPTTLQSEAAVMVDASGQPSTSGPYTRTVTVAILANNLKQVTVQVQAPKLANPVTLLTLAFVPQTQT